MRRFGLVLCLLICLSLGLQALGLDVLALQGLYPLDSGGGLALRLSLLAVGVGLWFGAPRTAEK